MNTEHVKLGPDGRIVLPAALRKSVGLNPGDTVVIESDGDSLLLRSFDTVVREAQDYFRQFPSPVGGEVDGLIAERRAEAARERAEDEADDARTIR